MSSFMARLCLFLWHGNLNFCLVFLFFKRLGERVKQRFDDLLSDYDDGFDDVVHGGQVSYKRHINSIKEEEIGQGASRREAALDDRGMGYKRSLTVKRRGGSGRLQITEDVVFGLRTRDGLDTIILEWNESKLGMIRWCWILPESRLSPLICHERRVVSRGLCTYQCESDVCTIGNSNNGQTSMNLPFDWILVNERDPNHYFLVEYKRR